MTLIAKNPTGETRRELGIQTTGKPKLLAEVINHQLLENVLEVLLSPDGHTLYLFRAATVDPLQIRDYEYQMGLQRGAINERRILGRIDAYDADQLIDWMRSGRGQAPLLKSLEVPLFDPHPRIMGTRLFFIERNKFVCFFSINPDRYERNQGLVNKPHCLVLPELEFVHYFDHRFHIPADLLQENLLILDPDRGMPLAIVASNYIKDRAPREFPDHPKAILLWGDIERNSYRESILQKMGEGSYVPIAFLGKYPAKKLYYLISNSLSYQVLYGDLEHWFGHEQNPRVVTFFDYQLQAFAFHACMSPCENWLYLFGQWKGRFRFLVVNTHSGEVQVPPQLPDFEQWTSPILCDAAREGLRLAWIMGDHLFLLEQEMGDTLKEVQS